MKPTKPKKSVASAKKQSRPRKDVSAREKCLTMARGLPAETIAIEACDRIQALWYAARFGADRTEARTQLLRVALVASEWLRGAGEPEDFEGIAPFAKGWPVVLADGNELTREINVARLLVKKLRAGSKHPDRHQLNIGGEFAEFVNSWISIALWHRDGRIPANGSVTVAAADLVGLPKLAEKALAFCYGDEWQDHPAVSKAFDDGRRFLVSGEAKFWKDCLRWEKRDVVRDKFEGAARTSAKKLARFGID